MEQAWSTETGASNPTVIAIIDTGVQMNHPDLQAKIVGGCDFYDGDNNPTPGPGIDHGTHVAGIAAAIGNNNRRRRRRLRPQGPIEPIKIFDDTGAGATTSMLIDAIRWAAGLAVSGTATNPHPADVINMSVGIPGDQPLVDQAATAAFNAGSLLVASSGNYGTGTPYATNPGVMSPANAPDVIAVGSVDSDHQISGFSAYSTGAGYATGVEVMAPGGFEVSPSYTARNCCLYHYYAGTAPDYGILSTYTGSNYGCDVGTSMASPFVAGVAALLKSHTPSLTPSQLRQTLDDTALFAGGMTADEYGHGIVCADLALDPFSATQCGRASAERPGAAVAAAVDGRSSAAGSGAAQFFAPHRVLTPPRSTRPATSPPGMGGAKKKPCARWQPSASSRSNWARVSTPSATITRSR